MYIYNITKKSGGKRLIFSPSKKEKEELRGILKTFLIKRLKGIDHAHGFIPGKNIVTNALPHVGALVTVSLDLQDFFDSCTIEKASSLKLSEEILERCFLKGPDGKKATRQGLPTSPALSNLIAKPLDEAIIKGLKKIGCRYAYTRYADDLSISLWTESREIIDKALEMVKQCVSRCGFKLNPKKTRVQYAKSGRREICGLMVDDTGVHIPRKLKRKLRAARHAYKMACLANDKEKLKESLKSLLGLIEFSMLKLPLPPNKKESVNQNRKDFNDAKRIVKKYKLQWGIDPYVNKILKDEILESKGERVYMITNDPCYFLGMSSFSKTFTNCMNLGKGRYHGGVAFWQRHPGVSLALEIDPSTEVSIAGVYRKAILSRALVYALRDGRRCFGKIYGGQTKLREVLESNGFVPCIEVPSELVEGHVIVPNKTVFLPYLDNTIAEKIILKPSDSKLIRLKIR